MSQARFFKLGLVLFAAASCAQSTQVDDGGAGTGTAGAAGGVSGSSGVAGTGGTAGTAAGGTGAVAGAGASGASGRGGAGASAGAGGAGGQGNTGGGGAGSGGAGGGAGSGGGAGRGGTGGNAGAGGASALLVPAQGVLFGAFVGTGTIPQLETTLGRKLTISHNFYGWTDDYTAWVRSTLMSGYIPLVTWEAWTGGSVGIPLDDIINGAHDSMIRTRAQACAAIGQKFFLRWGHEMNGNWYPWDGSHNGASTAATAKYIAAYRHIHDLFVSAGATNALWVFAPNVDSVPGDAWNQWSNYYPGDSYVDWMAFDGYNWGTVQTGSSWRTFASITSTIYAGLAAKGKPIMIPETASTEMGGDKAAWITAILPALKTSFPAIKAFVWFHMNKETDWRIDSSTQSRDAFVPMARDPYFNP